MRCLATVAILIVAATAAGVPGLARELRPPFPEVGFDQHLGESLPLDLPFRDETGRAVRLGDYFGARPVVLNLAYYRCPMLCTLVLNGIASSAGALNLAMGRDYDVITVSIDPRETSQMAAAKKEGYLKEYRQLGKAEGWHFLSGDEASIKRLADTVGFRYVYDPGKDQYAHPSGVVVITPAGKIAQYFFGIEYAPRDLRLSLVAASSGKIGSMADRLMLLCYSYDPATGRYGAASLSLIRMGGVATVLALSAFVVAMLRRDAAARRRQPHGKVV
ncbi:MAG TPA: SCO family protein [Patescibacteria group bacterium]|jgi:protein SCO1/2|nr:SCO family protein [Patescibacteria group bacterium]